MNPEKQISITEEYERVCKTLANTFANKYFGETLTDMWCVAEDPTGVWYIDSFWFTVDEMYQYIKYNYTKKKMFEHVLYKHDLKRRSERKDATKQNPVCIRDYKHLIK